MQILSAQHLAELLIGIARAQASLVRALDNERRTIPALEHAARLHDRSEPTLSDLPLRILLATLGRSGPDEAAIVKDLERLLAGRAIGGSPGEDLDFGAPP